MLSNTGAWSWSSGDGLASDLLREANTFCLGQGKQMMPVNVKSKDGGFDQFGHASIQFRCLREGDPQLQQSTLQRGPDLVVETRQR